MISNIEMISNNRKRRRISRPEPPVSASVGGAFYNKKEANRYTNSSQQVQAELTQRALDFLHICSEINISNGLLLDAGCGSGLSGSILRRHGYEFIGFDLSEDMLTIARFANQSVTDCVRSDMGHGFPTRSNLFSGAVSISALQWLCNSTSNNTDILLENDSTIRFNLKTKQYQPLMRFFRSLREVLLPGAGAVCQLYPRNAMDCRVISNAAVLSGFPSATLIVDCPHNNKSKKLFLCLPCSTSSTNTPGKNSLPICPLSWPLEASCTLCLVASSSFGDNSCKMKALDKLSKLHMNHVNRMRNLLNKLLSMNKKHKTNRINANNTRAKLDKESVKYCFHRRSRVEAFSNFIQRQKNKKRKQQFHGSITSDNKCSEKYSSKDTHLSKSEAAWFSLSTDQKIIEIKQELALIKGIPCFDNLYLNATKTSNKYVGSSNTLYGYGTKCEICDCIIKGSSKRFEEHILGAKHKKRLVELKV